MRAYNEDVHVNSLEESARKQLNHENSPQGVFGEEMQQSRERVMFKECLLGLGCCSHAMCHIWKNAHCNTLHQ